MGVFSLHCVAADRGHLRNVLTNCWGISEWVLTVFAQELGGSFARPEVKGCSALHLQFARIPGALGRRRFERLGPGVALFLKVSNCLSVVFRLHWVDLDSRCGA